MTALTVPAAVPAAVPASTRPALTVTAHRGTPRYRDLASMSDADLVRAALEQGDRGRAFAELHRRLAPMLAAFVRRRLPAAISDDAVQEAIVRLWRNLPKYDPARGPLIAFAYTIARSTTGEMRRRAARESTRVAAPPSSHGSTDLTGSTRSTRAARSAHIDVGRVDPGFDEVDLHGVVHPAMATLSANHRRVLDLAFWHGLSQPEVAACIGVPVGTVKTRTMWALRHLRSPVAGALAAA